MERKEINSDSFDWHALIRHVVGDHATVDLEQNSVPVVRITPLRKPVLMSELNGVLADLPTLGDDADQFATDIHDVRKQLPAERDPWES